MVGAVGRPSAAAAGGGTEQSVPVGPGVALVAHGADKGRVGVEGRGKGAYLFPGTSCAVFFSARKKTDEGQSSRPFHSEHFAVCSKMISPEADPAADAPPLDLGRRYQMHGYRPRQETDAPAITDDEQYLTLCLLVTRNSVCTQGHMGCLLVRGASLEDRAEQQDKSCNEGRTLESERDDPNQYEENIHRRIIGAATNRPLYSKRDSDVHAEIGAIGDAARRGHSTEGCTAYIAMPPCKNCFGALVSAGCRRVVAPRQPNKTVATAAVAEGVEMVTIDAEISDRIRGRIDALIHAGDGNGDAEKRQEEIAAKRKARKEAAKLKKEKRRRTAEENKRMHAGTNGRHKA